MTAPALRYSPAAVLAARLWWSGRFLVGLVLELLQAAWSLVGWVRGLPRENQGVLAVSAVCVVGGAVGVRQMLADTRAWSVVLGPPAWALGISAALVIAWGVRRPIVWLPPFALVVWWVSPMAAVVLVALTVLAVGWTTTTRGAHGKVTKRRTMFGTTVVGAHFAPDRHAHAAYAPGPGQKCSEFVAKHEGGHAAALVALGGVVTKARAFADGSGYCEGKLPCRPSLFQAVVDDVQFSVGGEVAVNSTSGCDFDHRLRDTALAMLRPDQRPMARTAGYAGARRAQSTHAHVQRAVANALVKNGSYR